MTLDSTVAADRIEAHSAVGSDARELRPRPRGLRVGVDVGGTFTKAVAIETDPFALRAEAVLPTSHAHPSGVMAGVADALSRLLADLGSDRHRVQLVAFSTTQAMNALLEGDVPRVGVVGIGARPDLRRARKRTRVGSIGLAPGRSLDTEHVFLDSSDGLGQTEIGGALDALQEADCGAVAISAAYAIESPEDELRVAAAAAERGLPVCCGHQLSEAYGLETRTVSAAVNAAILPVIERTAGLVEDALADAGLDVPLLVLRGDGGAMDVESFRARPSLTVGSGPAAGVAAALHRAGVADAVVVECGGTSTNVSAVVRGRPILRSIRVMERPTAIRSIDSWVVGMAGGSMIRLGRRGIAGTGPRSAHLAGLPYACFADPAAVASCAVELISPRPGDPAAYAVLAGPQGRFALTATCAANALGLVAADSHAAGSAEAARAGFDLLAGHVGRGDGENLARAALEAGLNEIRAAVEDAARAHGLGDDVPLLALGGAGGALVPELGRRLGRRVIEPDNQEVLASIGAATTLVRSEVARSATRDGNGGRAELVVAAERACVEAGAAADTITVETRFDEREGLIRATATGAVALESGAAERRVVDERAQLSSAADALCADSSAVERLSSSDFYAAFSHSNGAGERVAIVDRLGSVPVLESARRVIVGTGESFRSEVATAIEEATTNLGIASVIPRVTIACGPRLLDLSDSRRPEELLAAVDEALADHPGEAVALLAR